MPFQVTLAGLNTTFTVEDDETILDAALRQSIDIPYSCYSGICTTCKATCVSGEYDYGDFEIYGIDLDDNPNNELLLCSAFPKSNMIIHHPDISPSSHPKSNAIECEVVTRDKLTDHIHRITLKPMGAHSFEHWPGQYLLLEYAGESSPFSIANNSHENLIELHMLDAPYNPAPETLKSALFDHNQVMIKGPLGNAYLREGAKNPIIFVAGGSGFAAIKPMIEHLFHTGSKRDIHLYWGVRHPEYLYLDTQVKHWAKTHENFKYTPVISSDSKAWTGRTGLVHQAVLDDIKNFSAYQLYLTGPSDMVFTARDQFIQRGAAKDQIFSDAFEFEATAEQAEWD